MMPVLIGPSDGTLSGPETSPWAPDDLQQSNQWMIDRGARLGNFERNSARELSRPLRTGMLVPPAAGVSPNDLAADTLRCAWSYGWGCLDCVTGSWPRCWRRWSLPASPTAGSCGATTRPFPPAR